MIQFLYGLLIFTAGYLTARYTQYLKNKHKSLNEESKETRA